MEGNRIEPCSINVALVLPFVVAESLHQSAEDTEVWFIHENWRSPEGLDSHMKTTHVQAFLELVPAFVDGAIELQRFTMTSTPAAPRD